MKILLTAELYNPNRGGAQKVVEDLATSLSSRGHDVTVATTYLPERSFRELNGVRIEPFRIRGNATEGIKGQQSEIEKYQALLIDGGFDIIFNYTAQSWPTDLTFPVLDKINTVKLINPVGYSRISSQAYRDYFSVLPEHLEKYDRILYHSARHAPDKAYGDSAGLGYKAVIIPNGALGSEFNPETPVDIRGELGISTRYIITTVTHHLTRKGHRFVIRAFRKLRRDDVTLLIVGDAFTARGLRGLAHFVLDYLYCFASSLLHKNIRLAHGSRELAISVYKHADVCVSGSSWECAPLVMYESFASKTPFITTDVGNASDHKEYLKIVNTPEQMAKEVNYLLDNSDERYALAQKAYEFWRQNHVLEKIFDKYEALFKKLTA